MSEELTREQLNRQDYVDNMIWELVENLEPNKIELPDNSLLVGIRYDAEVAGEIRDIIENALWEKVGKFHYKNRDEFEMAFYPYLKEED